MGNWEHLVNVDSWTGSTVGGFAKCEEKEAKKIKGTGKGMNINAHGIQAG